MNIKHKFKNPKNEHSLSCRLTCEKCNKCYCFDCSNHIEICNFINTYFKVDITSINDHDIKIIRRYINIKKSCPISDQEYIIKQIIE